MVDMVRAVKQSVRVQLGGRVVVVSSDLPEGAEAEVIVLLSQSFVRTVDSWGLFGDEPELVERIVEDAMAARETPLRLSRGY